MAEVKKKIKPGAIEAHAEELAIVVHYEVGLGNGRASARRADEAAQRTWPLLRTCPCLTRGFVLHWRHARRSRRLARSQMGVKK